MEKLLQDVRYAVRVLAKSPGLATVALLSLALGIGANTAIFTIVDAVVLKLLPVAAPEQLVLVGSAGRRNPTSSFSHPTYKDLQDGNKVFSGLLAHAPVALSMSTEGQTERVIGEIVSGSYFSVLGVNAILGRTFTEQDDHAPGSHPVAVMSYGLWRRRFGLDPGLIGRTIQLNAHSFTVIGIAPANFSSTEIGFSPDVRIPLAMQAQLTPGWDALNRRDRVWLGILARLKPDVGIHEAQAAADVLYQQILQAESQSYPPDLTGQMRREGFFERRLVLSEGSRGLSRLRNQLRHPLLVMMAAVGMVLLIACANLATLLLARAAGRQKEIAVRLALGASRSRLVRQLLTESLLLSLIGGGLGLLLSLWASQFLSRFLPQAPMPIRLDLHPDARMVGFTLVVSTLTAVLFGLAPALQATRPDLTPVLKEESGALGRRAHRLALGKILVVAQVALSILLLVGAGLFVRTLWKLKALDPGFTRDRIVLLSLDPSLNGYGENETRQFYQRLVERLESLPGIRSASLARVSPLTGGGMRRTTSIKGYQPVANEDMNMNLNFVGPRYFETMGIPLLQGREFSPRDSQAAPRVAVINETMARRFWPNESPLGKRIGFGAPSPLDVEVIAVARDGKYRTLRDQGLSTVYLSYLQEPRAFEMSLHLRITGNPDGMVASVRHAVAELDKNLPIFNVRTLAEQVEASLVPERMLSVLSSFFGLLALLLAGIGLYGVMAYRVARRTREIGIRMALGAKRGSVLTLVLRESLLLVLIGLALGLGAALWATRVISSMLYDISATDPVTLLSVSLMMTAVAILASFLPALRATQVDPVTALRYE
jgi:predicted permease